MAAESRLVSASGAGNTASYAYDGLGRRKAKTVNGTTTVYVSDGDQEVLEYDGTSGQVERRYVYGAGLDEPLNLITPAGDRTTYIPDLQGSILASLDGPTGSVTKYGYQPFGDSSDSSGAFRYAGRRIDAETNGLYYNRARMYSPALGRFLQPDPIGFQGGPHLYAYVNNDPLDARDPQGLSELSIKGGIFSLTFGDYTAQGSSVTVPYTIVKLGLTGLGYTYDPSSNPSSAPAIAPLISKSPFENWFNG
ncbi:MAG TPA: RHS repeat-associated core domain-containing protein [Alphaproteobacteria bacterium]|nr:RHS repeat-associated core domain-containing protein [Alphaproteobacteria bacterium]